MKGGCGGGGNGGICAYGDSDSGSGGGGATSVFLEKSDIESRILVSAGGGGSYRGYSGGYAGGLIGGDGKGPVYTAIGATQTDGFEKGIGQNGGSKYYYADGGAEGNCGSGGGYWGGTAIQNQGRDSDAPGSGGSSYISGHPGCRNYSGYIFKKPIMLGGNETIALPNCTKSVGNLGNGHFRIKYYGPTFDIVPSIKFRVRKR
ncbi:PE-PGRS protein, putative [Trichomonas vaginalis G3]|uniref:receptor protein-tyrosine kinase n=1 Tax=Trichomonas vaginalis (strain ATCC PRA-98 / G3) TaxID=412133 RepID=A2EX98_TRIV3|nr:glycine-rich protein family [Trichomonas vaginalis G3]EAY02697.1 PE-PGRS protein, putative [Trichomonas vaginalis G3]KAI5513595.1 glycine-rich protein family [Trichomonas vaginalis G3]|eukprot:XP_001314920.1 PE-PGRS protein [Trichomonas vaginalis G3]